MGDDSPASKRMKRGGEMEGEGIGGGEMVVKVLVPTSVAGAIIGKGGETLRQLQTQVRPCFVHVLTLGT